MQPRMSRIVLALSFSITKSHWSDSILHVLLDLVKRGHHIGHYMFHSQSRCMRRQAPSEALSISERYYGADSISSAPLHG